VTATVATLVLIIAALVAVRWSSGPGPTASDGDPQVDPVAHRWAAEAKRHSTGPSATRGTPAPSSTAARTSAPRRTATRGTGRPFRHPIGGSAGATQDTAPPDTTPADTTQPGTTRPGTKPPGSTVTGGPSTGTTPATTAPAPAGGPAFRVSRNRFVDAQGDPIRLAGFNLSGAEYACIEGWGFFDTPDGSAPTDAQVATMAGWAGATVVRLPLNEQCWLGLGPAQYSGEAYRQAVLELVDRLAAHGLATLLDLHRSAPGDAASKEQEPMPDRDHSPAFWTSVATTFANWPSVGFDLFNEPFPFEEENTTRAWTCWRDGGCRLTSANSRQPYTAAGMQELVDAVRATGARNVVLAGGLYWAESMTQWLTYRPHDPAGQLAAGFHAYSFNQYCATVSCYDRDLTPIMAQVPLLAGEVGPDLPKTIKDFDTSCSISQVGSTGFATGTLGWLDAHGAGWTTWDWTPTNDCWSLTSSWQGQPTSIWGALVRRELAAG